MSPEEVDKMLKQILLKDLRVQCRARGLSPAGGKEQLSERLRDHMLATGDFAMKDEAGEDIKIHTTAGASSDDIATGGLRNNYGRPDGQNVGNFLTDRCSSRVLAPPGGTTSICFGDASSAPRAMPASHAPRAMPAPTAAPAAPACMSAPGAPPPGALAVGAEARANNNYSRPEGQNVGNFLTDKRAVKVHAPPGGTSQITFG